MRHRTTSRRTGPALLLLAALASMGLPFTAAPARAQRSSFTPRHPRRTSTAAGHTAYTVPKLTDYTAYGVVKATGQNRVRTGRPRTAARRPPVQTGINTAITALRLIKKLH